MDKGLLIHALPTMLAAAACRKKTVVACLPQPDTPQTPKSQPHLLFFLLFAGF
jgi:hypothetical protein